MAAWLLLGLMLTLQTQPAAVPPRGLTVVSPVTVVDSREIRFDATGNCLTRDRRSVDLHRVMFLDRGLTFDAQGGTFRAYVRGEKLLIDALEPDGDVRDTYFNRIDYQIEADGGGNLDIQIQLAFVEGHLAVYWRETWHNRIYKQGLYTIAGQSVAFLCQGEGGIRTED